MNMYRQAASARFCGQHGKCVDAGAKRGESAADGHPVRC
jgi:hypothetical protein